MNPEQREQAPQGAAAPEELMQQLLHQMIAMRTEVTGMRAENNAMRAEITTLRNRIDNPEQIPAQSTPTPQATPEPAAPAQESVPPPSKPRHALGHVDKYTHENPAEFMPFILGLETKLVVDGAAIGDAFAQLSYAYGCFSGVARDRIYPWYSINGSASVKESVTFETLDSFFQHVRMLFEDRHLMEKSNNQLSNLRQGRRPFRDFITEFEQLLLLSGGHTWSDQVRISRLKPAINQEMRKGMIGRPTAETYVQYVEDLYRVANDIEEVNRIDSLRRRRVNRSFFPQLNPAPTAPAPVLYPHAMDTSNAAINATRTTEPFLCYNCGRPNHLSRNCPEPQRPCLSQQPCRPLGSDRRSQQVNNTTPAATALPTVRFREPTVEEEPESEKE
jgi:hypothetical protein